MSVAVRNPYQTLLAMISVDEDVTGRLPHIVLTRVQEQQARPGPSQGPHRRMTLLDDGVLVFVLPFLDPPKL